MVAFQRKTFGARNPRWLKLCSLQGYLGCTDNDCVCVCLCSPNGRLGNRAECNLGTRFQSCSPARGVDVDLVFTTDKLYYLTLVALTEYLPPKSALTHTNMSLNLVLIKISHSSKECKMYRYQSVYYIPSANESNVRASLRVYFD